MAEYGLTQPGDDEEPLLGHPTAAVAYCELHDFTQHHNGGVIL